MVYIGTSTNSTTGTSTQYKIVLARTSTASHAISGEWTSASFSFFFSVPVVAVRTSQLQAIHYNQEVALLESATGSVVN
jgi:hypothetical protein